MMIMILETPEAAAPRAKLKRELVIPVMTIPTPMKITAGNMMRVSCTARVKFSAGRSGAVRCTKPGATRMPNTVKPAKRMPTTLISELPTREASSSEPSNQYLVKIGTTTVTKAEPKTDCKK